MLNWVNSVIGRPHLKVSTACYMFSNSPNYHHFAPIDQNINRLLRLSGTNGPPITPYEVSCWLYGLARLNFPELEENYPEIEKLSLSFKSSNIFSKTYNYIFSKTIRNILKIEEEIPKLQQLKSLGWKSLFELLNYTEGEAPVATASNALFACVLLNLETNEQIEKHLLPLIEKKMEYLHAEGIVETILSLEILEVGSDEFIKKLGKELDKRDARGLMVQPGRWNHEVYFRLPDEGSYFLKLAEVLMDHPFPEVSEAAKRFFEEMVFFENNFEEEESLAYKDFCFEEILKGVLKKNEIKNELEIEKSVNIEI